MTSTHMDATTHVRASRNYWSLALVFALIQIGLHAWYASAAKDPRLIGPHAVSWLHDVLLLLGSAAGFTFVSRLLGRLGASAVWTERIGTGMFYGFGMFLALYPSMLVEFLAFPANVFRADAGSTYFFIRNYLGWRGLLPPLLSGLCALWITLPEFRVSRKASWRAGTVFSIVVLMALLGPSPHPLTYAVKEQVREWMTRGPRAVPTLKKPAPNLSPENVPPVVIPQFDANTPIGYQHLLVVVMETVTTRQFERTFATIPDGYFQRVQNQSEFFTEYYTTNLDSITALIAMLTSVQVPYRAYAQPQVYAAVHDEDNIVAQLRHAGFETLFVCTAANQPFIPVRHAWDAVVHMKDLPDPDRFVALRGNKLETAAEDRAAMPVILDFMSNHSKSVVLHELVVGHSPAWQSLVGKPQLEYYDDYLVELNDALRVRDLLDDLLLVVVADHGDRSDPAKPENYHVPLLVTGSNVVARSEAGCFSHRELPGILTHFLTGCPMPRPRESHVTVGSTESWVYGEITSNGESLFIDNRSGTVLQSEGGLNPSDVCQKFQRQLNAFAAAYQR